MLAPNTRLVMTFSFGATRTASSGSGGIVMLSAADSRLSKRLAGVETPSHTMLAASEGNGRAASATSPGLARSRRHEH